jgi:hypothetical protein
MAISRLSWAALTAISFYSATFSVYALDDPPPIPQKRTPAPWDSPDWKPAPQTESPKPAVSRPVTPAPAAAPAAPIVPASAIAPAAPASSPVVPALATQAAPAGAGAMPPVQPAVYTTGTISYVDDVEPMREIQPVAYQPRPDIRSAPIGEEAQEYNIRLTPPGPETLFRRDSEAQLLERMRQEALSQPRPDRIEFPHEEPYLTKEPYQKRRFPPISGTVEPNYTAYRRLNFEQINFERYGWDLGIVTPFLSAAVFFKDVLFLPYHAGTEVCRRYEVNSGYCLPGTPVPLLLYPPQFSLLGTFFEASAVAGVLLVFPG